MRFTIFVAVAWSIFFTLHAISYLSLSTAFGFTIPNWEIVAGTLAFTYFAASYCARRSTRKIFDVFYFLSACWLGTIFVIFSWQLGYQAIRILTGYESVFLAGSFFIASLLVTAYALYNGRHLTIKEYDLPITGLSKKIRAVHLTDIHIGTVHQTKFLKEVVDKTNNLQPEIVFITGDLFDGSVPINEKILSPLNSINAPAYFSNGNHEEYEGLEYVRKTLEHIAVEQLENRFVLHNESLQVIGVNDRQSLHKDETLDDILVGMDLNPVIPTVLMYHTPVEWESAQKHNVDLMLSGHTHNGQIYPFTLLVRLFFKHVMGLYEEGGKFLHVSPGTGTWGPPMRLGSKNQITVLNLVPKD